MTNGFEKRRSTSSRTFAWVVGGVLGVVLALVVLGVANRQEYPSLRRPQWDDGRRRWAEVGPANYDITIQVFGRQAATYSVEVRDGEVQSASRNGQPLKQRRTFDTWSVPGMFETIGRDLENLEKVESGRADPTTPRLTLRGKFDEKLGYPLRYLRIESTRGVENPEVTWEVTRFQTVEP